MDPEFGPVLGASKYWHISRGLGLHFGAGEPLELIFGIAQSGRSDHFFSNMQPENSKV